MGRDCGYIALMAGIAGGAEVIALPESEILPAQVAERLRDAYRRGKTHALAVIAEGAKCGVHELMEYYNAQPRRDRLRAARHAPRPRGARRRAGRRRPRARHAPRRRGDRDPGRGRHGVLVGIVKNDVVTTPLADIAGRTRPADASLLELARVMAI